VVDDASHGLMDVEAVIDEVGDGELVAVDGFVGACTAEANVRAGDAGAGVEVVMG
jgi:hypothetical protein